jgi:hypothetical protein
MENLDNTESTHLTVAPYMNLEFVTDQKEILTLLTNSKESNKAIAISSVYTGPGFIVTAVEDIILGDSGAITVIFKSFDMTGHFLERNKLKLSEINGVIAFESDFENPFIKQAMNSNTNVA